MVFFPLLQYIFQFVDWQMKKGCLLKENLRNVGILTRVGTCLVSQIRTDALSVAFGLLWLYPVLMPILINAHLYVHKSVHLPLWSQHTDK